MHFLGSGIMVTGGLLGVRARMGGYGSQLYIKLVSRTEERTFSSPLSSRVVAGGGGARPSGI